MKTLREGVRVSRGRARCSICWRRIAPGTRYWSQTNVDESRIWEFVECPACEEAAGAVERYLGVPLWDSESDDGDAFTEWCDDVCPVADEPSLLVWVLSGGCARFKDCGAAPVTDMLRRLQLRAARAKNADASVDQAWDDDEWAAFTWRMRTSRAVFPEGVVGR